MDLYPGLFRKSFGVGFEREGKTGDLRLTRERDRDHCLGTLVKDILTEDQNRAEARLLPTSDRIEIGPSNFAS